MAWSLTINYATDCGSRCNKVFEWIMGFGVVLGLGLGSRPGISSWCPRPEPVFRVLREGSVRSGIQLNCTTLSGPHFSLLNQKALHGHNYFNYTCMIPCRSLGLPKGDFTYTRNLTPCLEVCVAVQIFTFWPCGHSPLHRGVFTPSCGLKLPCNTRLSTPNSGDCPKAEWGPLVQ